MEPRRQFVEPRNYAMTSRMPRAATFLLICLVTPEARADVSLSWQWGEGMVLQSGLKTPLNGTAKAGEKVSVTYRGQTYAAEADKFGKWKVEIDPGAAGGPLALTVQGNNTIELKDIHVADLQLASVLGDGMVLQRGGKAPIFGTAVPGSKVSVRFRDQTAETTAASDSSWRIDVTPGAAGGPFPMTIAGQQTVELKEVYVGEVWLCSGQSNMNWSVSYTQDAGKLPLDQTYPLLRLQKYRGTGYAPNHPPGRYAGWQPAHKKAVLDFSGTGYFFGAALQEKLQVPVGLIHAAVDATGIQEWTPGAKLQELKLGAADVENHYVKQVRAAQPFAIRGAIWYQGEGNASKDPFNIGYQRRLSALIEGWRSDWGQGDFPFLYVQLPRIGFGADQVHNGKLPTAEQKEIVGEWARVRDEQRQVLSMQPNVGMAVYYEHTTGMLHPPQKRQAGERLALAARALVYGEKIEYSGPLFESASRQGDEVVVRFKHAAGLTAKDGVPRQFEAAGADGKFTAVKARLDRETIRLDVTGVPGELTVRYAHREWPDGNLLNAAGLPASPFVVSGVK